MGIRMNVKKIRSLMRKYKLTCPIRKPNPYRRLQRSIRMGSAAENSVNREFESHGPRAILLTDITYIPLCGRFCYLSTILDACTKQVLAYAMSESLEVDFVLETVQLLVKHHGISLSKETVIHSDQGTHLSLIHISTKPSSSHTTLKMKSLVLSGSQSCFSMLLPRPRPVSYTHLDVYKRQPTPCSAPSSSSGRVCAACGAANWKSRCWML